MQITVLVTVSLIEEQNTVSDSPEPPRTAFKITQCTIPFPARLKSVLMFCLTSYKDST